MVLDLDCEVQLGVITKLSDPGVNMGPPHESE